MIDTPLADEIPSRLPVVDGTDQLKVVPAGTMPLTPLVGVTLKVVPLQITALIAVIAGVGLIVTVTLNTKPVQLPVIGVTKYVAVLAMFVVLASVPIISDLGDTCVAPPVNPVPVGADQLYNVPAGTTPFVTSVGVTVN